jgi:hypothetical protein
LARRIRDLRSFLPCFPREFESSSDKNAFFDRGTQPVPDYLKKREEFAMSWEIHFRCRCGARLETDGSYGGGVVRCPSCSTHVTVPGAVASAQPVRQSNVERLAGWGLWYVYWKLFDFGCGLVFAAGAIVLFIITAQNSKEGPAQPPAVPLKLESPAPADAPGARPAGVRPGGKVRGK